jgi:hypothetical protein
MKPKSKRGEGANSFMSDPMDEIVEKDLKKSRKWADPYLNSVDPPGLEGTGLGKNNEEFIEFERGEEKEEERKESPSYTEDSFEASPPPQPAKKRVPRKVKPTRSKKKKTRKKSSNKKK